MGCEVSVFSRSSIKESHTKALGADLWIRTDEEAVNISARTYDVILDTVSVRHAAGPLIGTLKAGGVYVFLGGVTSPYKIHAFSLLLNRHSIEGSLVGGVPETQKMLCFATHFPNALLAL
jgi:alcohol dehydrogenase (NADP+)